MTKEAVRFAVMQSLSIIRSDIFWIIGGSLVAMDSAFIFLHLMHWQIIFPNYEGYIVASNMFSVDVDRSYGEFFQYVKTVAIVMALLACFTRSRSPIFAALACSFLITLLDDSVRLHERIGRRVVAALGYEPMVGLRAQDLGELTVWAVLGIGIVAALAVGFRRSDTRHRGVGLIFAALFSVLAFFGIGVDMLHSEFALSSHNADLMLALAEDGGEMLVVSVICATAATLALPMWNQSGSGIGADEAGGSAEHLAPAPSLTAMPMAAGLAVVAESEMAELAERGNLRGMSGANKNVP